jgi:hypothetical protein
MLTTDPIIGAREFGDGVTRPVCQDVQAQYVYDDDGSQVRGVFIHPDNGPERRMKPNPSTARTGSTTNCNLPRSLFHESMNCTAKIGRLKGFFPCSGVFARDLETDA